MKRRHFNLLAASSLPALGLGLGAKPSRAAVTTAQADLLKTTLTPFGAERAGNADGTIPAWTGGLTEVPAGWDPTTLMPDFFASDQKIVSINASNMTQYQDRLSVGVMAMMQKYPEFRIDVYPTHRTATAPQWVYDNIYQNALTAKPDPAGARIGFSGAYGGVPFPIPDSDPYQAGAEIMWNHNCRWEGISSQIVKAAYSVSNGKVTFLNGYTEIRDNPFYFQDGNLQTFNGWLRRLRLNFNAPANINGQQIIELQPNNAYTSPLEFWEYLTGQGRVRKAPELTYDTPSATAGDIASYDEYTVFFGAQDRYDWKLIGKKEMYIPYNANKLILTDAEVAHQPNFINPDVLRWELHRVWVVDATLHPGARNVVAHRRMYVDEDSWMALIADEWDAQGNIWKLNIGFNNNRPDVPALVLGNNAVFDLQTDQYVTLQGQWGNAPYNGARSLAPVNPSNFNPQTMAAAAQF